MAEFRLSLALETVTQLVKPTANMKILDVATGTGKGMLALAGGNAKIVGLDSTDAMLQIARGKSRTCGYSRLHFVRGNAAQLPFPAETFDAVISLNFLHLFPPVSLQEVFTKFLGLVRKRFGVDLGFNDPRDIRRMLCPEFEITRVVGGHFPGVWRLSYLLSKVSPRASRFFTALTRHHPWKYIAYNIFVKADKS